MEFQDWTVDALQSLASDAGVSRHMVEKEEHGVRVKVWYDPRAWAAWELDYRIAFEVADAPDEVVEKWRNRNG